MNASSLLRFPAWLCLGAIACAEAADVPDVPNLNALQREYDDPSAGLDPEEASALIERFPELEQLAAALRAADPVLVRIDDARGAADERTGSAVELQGALTLDLSCPGADRTPRFDPATNGSLSLQLAVERSEIRQAFWGEARRCVLRGALGPVSFPVEIDGLLAFDVGNPIPLGGAWQRGTTLISHQGTLSFGSLTLRDVSARLGQDRFEYLFQVPGGSVILLVTDDVVGVRDRNATWSCDRRTLACAAR